MKPIYRYAKGGFIRHPHLGIYCVLTQANGLECTVRKPIRMDYDEYGYLVRVECKRAIYVKVSESKA